METTEKKVSHPPAYVINVEKPAHPTNARMHSDAMGMTKREMFAMAAMQGMLSNSFFAERMDGVDDIDDLLSKRCIQVADAILKQLEE